MWTSPAIILGMPRSASALLPLFLAATLPLQAHAQKCGSDAQSTISTDRPQVTARVSRSALLGYEVARLLVSRLGMFMSLRRVLMSEVGVLLSFLVIALFMVIGRCVVGLGCVFVMFGCLAVCFVCHRQFLDFRDLAFFSDSRRDQENALIPANRFFLRCYIFLHSQMNIRWFSEEQGTRLLVTRKNSRDSHHIFPLPGLLNIDC
jgi:hypothetical protein